MEKSFYKRHRQWILLAGLLVLLAVVLHGLHWLIFRDFRHIMLYLLGDIAFLPIEVVVVAMVMERILSAYERGNLLQKMNMVIGTFFAELGTHLLGVLTQAVANREQLLPHLLVAGDWDAARWKASRHAAEHLPLQVDLARLDLEALQDLLQSKRDLLVLLLANPNLMEHEHFTDLLWAVCHLMDELAARPSLRDLPATDREHLAGDVRRAYTHLVGQWLPYCRHLQEAYPYIFSIVVRTNPVQAQPNPIVTT